MECLWLFMLLNLRTICFIADMQTIDTCQAAFLPIGASASLLIMFLFFDSLQMVFAICTAGELHITVYLRQASVLYINSMYRW